MSKWKETKVLDEGKRIFKRKNGFTYHVKLIDDIAPEAVEKEIEGEIRIVRPLDLNLIKVIESVKTEIDELKRLDKDTYDDIKAMEIDERLIYVWDLSPRAFNAVRLFIISENITPDTKFSFRQSGKRFNLRYIFKKVK